MNNKPVQLSQIDRQAFFKELVEQLNRANQFKTKAGLLLIDIDKFHRINDQYGYDVGDRILAKFDELLGTVARQQDCYSRIGDNLFALLLNGILNQGHAELAARKVLRLLEMPFNVAGNELHLQATISIALCPTHARDARYLLNKSEQVLLAAKNSGLKVAVADEAGSDEFSENWEMEMSLSRALNNDELHVYYQPKVDILKQRVVGAEALLRWKNAARGFVSPGVFIPLAESTGLIKPITNWVINTSLRQAASWPDRHGSQSVSVNIPPDFLLMPDFVDMVRNALKLWGSPDITLTLEIVERSLVTQVEQTIHVLHELRDMGVEISIDDFGTGYSSLSYFEKLPVNELKIDQSFVFNLLENAHNRSIVKLVIDLAHAFDLKVVAEGVEEQQITDYLRQLGCDVVQGYLYAKPLPQDDYVKWLKTIEL